MYISLWGIARLSPSGERRAAARVGLCGASRLPRASARDAGGMPGSKESSGQHWPCSSQPGVFWGFWSSPGGWMSSLPAVQHLGVLPAPGAELLPNKCAPHQRTNVTPEISQVNPVLHPFQNIPTPSELFHACPLLQQAGKVLAEYTDLRPARE